MKYLPLLLIIFAACNTTKHINTVTVDSTMTKRYDSAIVSFNKEKQSLLKQLTDAKKTQVKFQKVPCPPIPKLDSSFCNEDSLIAAYNRLAAYTNSLKNKVTVMADGSVKYEGQISSFKSQLDHLESMNYRLDRQHQDSLKVTDSLRAEYTKAQSELSKKTKGSLFGRLWWLLLLAGFVGGWFVRSKIKSPLWK